MTQTHTHGLVPLPGCGQTNKLKLLPFLILMQTVINIPSYIKTFNSFSLMTFEKMGFLEVVMMGAMNLALRPNVKCTTI